MPWVAINGLKMGSQGRPPRQQTKDVLLICVMKLGSLTSIS